MKKQLTTLAIMSFLVSSLGIAQETVKSPHSAGNQHKCAIEDSQHKNLGRSKAQPLKKDGKTKKQSKAPCSREEKEFDKVLLGIYG